MVTLSSRTEFVSMAGTVLAVDHLARESGSGEATGLLVFIPGWCCPRQDFEPIARRLVEDLPDVEAVLLDLPGQGRSTSDRVHWTMADLGAVVADLIRRRAAERVVLVGHSMGGAVAVEAAIELGAAAQHVVCVDALVYESYYAQQPEPVIARELAVFDADFAGAMRNLVEALFVDRSSPLIADIAHTMASAPKAPALQSQRTLLEWNRDSVLPRCPAAVDVLAAQAFLDPAVATRLAPYARVKPVDLGGHFFLLERPVDTALAIKDLIATRGAAAVEC